MADFDAWLTGNTHAPVANERAGLAWRRIQDKPTVITVNRDGVTLPAQTVRIEYNETERVVTGEANGTSSSRDVILFGVKNHPTVADTDLKYGDRFAYNGQMFHVVFVITSIGEIQANCEALT